MELTTTLIVTDCNRVVDHREPPVNGKLRKYIDGAYSLHFSARQPLLDHNTYMFKIEVWDCTDVENAIAKAKSHVKDCLKNGKKIEKVIK